MKPVYYCELYVENLERGTLQLLHKNLGYNHAIAIGLADKRFPNYRFPGWSGDGKSYGYHSDDGTVK